MRPSNNLENKIPSDTYWRVQLVCKTVQAHSSLEPPLVLHIMQFQISSRRENRYRDIPKSSGLEFLEVFSKQFCFIKCRRQHLRATFWIAKFLGSDCFFCFNSICKFSIFKTPFAIITSLSKIYFRLEDFCCWYQ